MADDLTFGLEVNTGNSAAQVKALATALSGLADQFREVSRGTSQIANQAERIERGLTGMGKGAKQAAEGYKDLAAAQAKLTPYKAASAMLAKARPDEIKLDAGGNARSVATGKQLSKKYILEEAAAQEAATAKIVAALNKEEAEIRQNMALRKASLQQMREARNAGGIGPKLETSTAPGSAKDVASRFQASGMFMRQDAANQAATLKSLANANMLAAKAEMDHINRLTNLRYSLYDVQRSFLVTGLGIAAFEALTLKAAMTYETAMAQISRTSNIAGQDLAQVRDQFIDLAQTIPTSFENLSKIGTLGGQLNIPSERLADFTKTVAQFTTTTNVATEQAATAFGRLDALLPDVQGNYEALGSSILNVGINSVATETEIINTTNQIAAAGAQAKFTADQVIGLAASYASLGVAPEAARGTTIRFFSEISTAISEGGTELEQFAQLSGKTAQEFQKDWAENSGEAFLDLLAGMQKVGEQGGNVEAILRSMGITAVRDINALLKLSQNAEVVAANFGYAAEGFDEATQLGAAFEVQAATLASKLQVLVNTVQALFAEMGDGGLPIIGAIVDGMNGFLKLLTSLIGTPAVQYAAALAGGLGALVAVLALVGFALARVTSATIAARQAFLTMKNEAVQAALGASGLKAQLLGLQGALFGTATGAKVLKGALISTGIGVAFLALGFAAEGFIASLDKMRPAAERAKEAFGDLSTLGDALKQDTAAAEDGARSYNTITGEVTRSKEVTAEWAQELNRATGVQTTLSGAIETTTTSLGNQVFQIGNNTKAWIAQKLSTDEALKSFLIWSQQMQTSTGLTFNTKGFITALTENDTKTALAVIQKYQQDVNNYLNANPLAGFELRDSGEQISELKNVVDLYAGAVQNAATETEIVKQVMDATGLSAEQVAYAMGDASGEILTAADSLSVLRDTIASAFADQNLVGQMTQDFYNLALGVYESGASFSAFSAEGMANLENFQASIGTIIAAGETMGLSASQSVAVLFLQLQRMGIDTANLLAAVANIPGINVGSVGKAMGGLSSQGQKLNGVLSQVSDRAKTAARSLGGGGGGGGSRGGGGGGGVAGGAKKAAQEVRTLVDYASDLAGVLNRAFDIRFSVSDNLDSITSGWDDIKQSTEDALQSIQQINAEVAKLNATKAINSYFLGVAEQYGDSLRAADIRAELVEIDTELADKQKDLAEEQAKTNKSLVGNTQAAIGNRKSITDLVKQYEELIESYASSGMDQAQLAAKTEELKMQFIAQAQQLGYNSEELQVYAAAFDDVALSIQRVPRNVTVSANISPALQALAEFEAKAQRAAANAASAIRNGGGGGIGGGGYNVGNINFPDLYAMGADAARRWKIGWNSQTQTFQTRDAATGAWVRTNTNIFKSGGYTGDGSSSGISGLVHGKEFVVNAENTAKFRPLLEAMNNGRMPIMSSNTSSTGVRVVELSARDRALLAAAGNVSLSIDGRVVADATNSANFVATKRGSS